MVGRNANISPECWVAKWTAGYCHPEHGLAYMSGLDFKNILCLPFLVCPKDNLVVLNIIFPLFQYFLMFFSFVKIGRPG